MLRVYALASYQHCRSYAIVETLIKSLAGKIESFQEADVLSVIRAYEYISNDEKYSARLFSDLNATVVESAAENKASVDVGFILNYLNQLFVNNQMQGARDITPAQRDTMVKLLEEKLHAGETLNPKFTSALSRILIRAPSSVIVRDHLLKLVQTNSKRLQLDETWLAINSLMNAFSKTQEKAQLRTLELQILSDYKEKLD